MSQKQRKSLIYQRSDGDRICPACSNRFKSPVVAEMWKVFSDPIFSIYSNLAELSHNLEWFLSTLLKCNREMTDLFIPKAYSHRSKITYRMREEQYKAFAIWLLGHIFYINGKMSLRSLCASSIDVQVKWMNSIRFQNNHIYTTLFREYILVLEDMLTIKGMKCEFQKFTLKRFTPCIIVVDHKLKLNPIYIEVESETSGEHVTETVLKIFDSVIDGVNAMSENMFLDIMKIIVEAMKVWGPSVQAAAVRLATSMFRLKMTGQNRQVWEIFCYQVEELISTIPHFCQITDNKSTENLVDSIFGLFTEILNKENDCFLKNDTNVIKLIWRFSGMECMNCYAEKRKKLLSLFSTSVLSKVPRSLVKYNQMTSKVNQVVSFLNSIDYLELNLRNEILSSFQNFVNEARNNQREDTHNMVWSVKMHVPSWQPFLRWFENFSSSDHLNLEEFPAILSLSSQIVKIAAKLSHLLKEEVLVSSILCRTMEISFFDENLYEIFKTHINILVTLDDQEINKSSLSYYEEVFHAIGNLLQVSSSSVNMIKKIKTAIAMLSLPWIQVKYDWVDIFISKEVFQNLQQSFPDQFRTKLQCISLSYLGYVPKNVAFPWRFQLLEICMHSEDEDVVVQAIKSLPFYMKNASKTDSVKKILELLNGALLSNKILLHTEIAKIVRNLICAMKGNTYIRNCSETDLILEMICEDCNPSHIQHPDAVKTTVKNLPKVSKKIFELFHSQCTELRLEMAIAIPSIVNHMEIIEPWLLSKCLLLLEDPDYSVRLSVSENICFLAYPGFLATGKSTNSNKKTENHMLNMGILQGKERFDSVYSTVFRIVRCCLVISKREFQETILIAIKNLGSVICDYAVFPVLKLLVIFLIHPSSAVTQATTTYFIEFCKIQKISPAQMYAKFRVEVCTIIYTIVLMSMSKKKFRLSSIIKKVAFMFEMGSPFDFTQGNLQYILPPLIPSLKKQGKVQILDEIAFFLSTSTNQLLVNQFRNIYSHLYLNEDKETFDLCMNFIREVGNLDVSLLKKMQAEGIQNQLILHLHLQPDKVISGLSEFIVEERSSRSKPADASEQVADLLQPRILGILLYLDSMITAPTACLSKKEQALACLPELIKFMGPQRLTPIKFKIMATLKTSLRFTDGKFPVLTCNAWEAFVHNVELASLGSLVSQVFISLFPLLEKFPEQIGSIFRYLVIENKEAMKDHMCELYFVQNHEGIEDVYQEIQQHMTEFWPADFQGCLALLHKYVTHDHVEVKLNGLKRLRKFLKEHQEELRNFVLNFENEDFILSEVIDALFIGCRDRDPQVRIACGECFGELGAIDSARLPRNTSPKDERQFIFDIGDEEFAVAALTKFLKAFMSARDAADMDRFAFAIQVFLKAYLASMPNESKRGQFWNKFPPDMQQIMKPFKSTRYMLSSESDDAWKPHPIYGSTAGTSFQSWAYRWVCNMLTIEKDSFKLEILSACRGCLKVDMNVVIFLLPHIFVNAVIKANEEQSWKLVEEVMTVISSPSIDSKKAKLIGDVRSIKLRTLATAKSHTDSPQEMRVMCLNTVFSLIDYLAMWVQEWYIKFGAKEEQNDRRPITIKSFLNKICKLIIANKNFECREYPRALQYLEQYVKEQPLHLGEQYNFFEKIYARLNDPDAVAGVLAVQEQQPTIEQLILSHEANGQWQDAATCYEKMAQSGCPETGYAMGMVNCYLKLDQPHAALGLIKGLSAQRPELAKLFVEYSDECLMKMSNWDQLSDKNKIKDSITSNLWNVSIGSALLNLRGENSFTIPHIDSMREALMRSLCAFSIDKGAYERGYQFIIRSQILNEIEQAAEFMEALQKSNSKDGEIIIEKLLNEWNGKLKFVLHSTGTLEQILSVRRMILSIIHQHFKEKSLRLSNLLTNEIGSLWIESAKIARNSGYFQQSYMYILNAEKFGLKNAFLEKAKLYWDRNDTNLAISTLRKGIAQTFPDATQFKVLKDMVPLEDRKTCAEAKLLFAHFNDKNINADIDENLHNYKDSVETYQKWEKNLVYLAQYYDRILDAINADDEDKGREAQLYMINYFGKSLEFGCEYMYHSIPRMLTIWLDYGAKLAERKESDKRDIFAKMTKLIETYAGRLPSFMFLSAFSQITTRLCHPHPLVYSVLKNIIAKIISVYPHQSLWMIMAVYKSSNAVLSRKCGEIFSICKKKDRQVNPIINDYIKLTDLLIALCNKKVPESANTTTIMKLAPTLTQMLKGGGHSKMSLPLQKLINITMPLNLDTPQTNHNPFPKEPVYISGIEDKVYIFSSLQKPKKITLLGSDGNQYTLLCKSKDDLRKDLRVMEFNRIVNSFLRSDAEACQRCLLVRTYSVVPLNEDCGVIEWVPNLIGLRSLLNEIYAKKGKPTTTSELRKMMCDLGDSLLKKKSVFLDKLIPRHPPVFDTWFYRTFPDPQSWYMARNAYIRTTAVMSIVGYVLGLGDRHGENILFDSRSGDTVHVDLSCIFNMGEKFNWPERVPFRLTHNMVAAMGSNGIEGIFRRSCEITMKILKQESSTLIAVLTPFVYDPTMSSRGTAESHEVTNEVAQEHLHNIKQRLQGYVSTKGGRLSLPLSTEGQVEKLISEATSIDNLCQMYIGWGAYL